MASNPNVNKVVYGNDTLIDLTEDTVTADKILQGYTAHDRSGAGITGTYVAPATPTDITPSNTTPPALSIDVPVNPKDTGYAIKSYANTTPTLDGVYFPSGFNKMGISGYAYSQEPEVEDYEVVSEQYTTTKTITITGKAGKKLLVLLYSWSSSTIPYNRYDNATITGGTLTKLTNLTTSNSYTDGTYFVVDVTSDTCVISHGTNFAYKVFEAVGGVIPSQQQVKTGKFTTNTTSSTGYKVTLGFKPKYICCVASDGSTGGACVYNKDVNANKYERSVGQTNSWINIGGTPQYLGFVSIDDDGFTIFTGSTWSYNTIEWAYFAIGE